MAPPFHPTRCRTTNRSAQGRPSGASTQKYSSLEPIIPVVNEDRTVLDAEKRKAIPMALESFKLRLKHLANSMQTATWNRPPSMVLPTVQVLARLKHHSLVLGSQARLLMPKTS